MAYSSKWYDNYELLYSMYVEQGLKVPEVASKIGVSIETVRKLLIKHGLMGGK